MGRAKNFNKYHNSISYGTITSVKRRVFIKNRNMKQFIRDNKGHFSYDNDSELPLGKTCKIVGVYNGPTNRKYFNPNYTVNTTVRECLRRCCPEFSEFDDTHSVNVLPGSWKFNHENLVDMATDRPVKYTYDDLLAGLRSRKNIDLVLPKIPFYDVNSIDSIRVNHKSYPGLNTGWLLGKRRNITTQYTKPFAKAYVRDIIMHKRNGYVLDTSLYHVGGREKRLSIPYSKDYKTVKTRVTLSPEDVPTIIGQSVIVNINESLQKLAKGFNWGGRLNGRGQFLKFVSDLKPKNDLETNFNTDFSGHDNNVTEEEMVTGIALLRCCYPESESIDRLFFYITSSLVFKRIVSPESNIIYELSKGLPTGHSFTSLLTTITAYLKISTAITKVIPSDKIKNTFLQGAGDDWNGLMPKQYLSKVSDHINRYSGATCDSFLENSGSIILDRDDNKPTFLKKNYKNGLIAWNRKELFTNYSYPTSNNRTTKDFIENTIVMCSSGPFDYQLNTIMKNLIIVRYFEQYLTNYSYNHKSSLALQNTTIDSEVNKVMDLAGFFFKQPIDIMHEIFNSRPIYNNAHVRIATINFRGPLQLYLTAFDNKINASHKFMLSSRIYTRFETLVRLKVFDTKKKYIPNANVLFHNSIFHKIYLLSTRMAC